MALEPGQRATADRVIRALAGPAATLRDDQLTAVEALVEPGARVLVVQATGWGKSAVYWVSTALRRAAGAGPTLVVSPLLALMRDQVAAAHRAGLRAATINSSNFDEWAAIVGDPEQVMERLTSPSAASDELRQNSPFAGVLGDAERARILAAFAEWWRATHAS